MRLTNFFQALTNTDIRSMREIIGSKKGLACGLVINREDDNEQFLDIRYGEPFTFQFYTYHGIVNLYSRANRSDANCWNSALYRIGD